jgi:hypothetical protein
MHCAPHSNTYQFTKK